jgi:hypothetical protein
MSKKFILTESEKNEIKKLYGLLTEVAKSIVASTSPERMPNFIGKGNKNSTFGLKGDAKQENFYFKSTIGDLVSKSTGDTKLFLSGFQPASDAGQYVDYVKVGTSELTNKGGISFDLGKLPVETEVIATHNGLLVLRRMMDQLGGSKNGKVTLSMSAEQRVSGQKTFDLAAISGNIAPNLNGIATALSVLFIPTNERPYIKESYAKQYFAGKTDDELKQAVNTFLKRGLVGVFLTPEDKSNIDKIISDKKLVTTLDMSGFESFYGKGSLKSQGQVTETVNSAWNTFIKSYKDTLINNFRAYLDEDFKYLADNLLKMTSQITGVTNLWSTYSDLKKETKLAQGTKGPQNTKTQTSQSYEIGK